MNTGFSEQDVKKIAEVLGAAYQKTGNMFRIKVTAEQRELSLEIHPDMLIGDTTGDLISVYTPTSHLQLHFCSGYVISESLGEVTFVGEHGGRLSGLIVEQGAGCSLFANVDRKLLSGDFTRLGPEVMLTGLALSLTEDILPDQITDI